MRNARPQTMLALAPLLLLGTTLASANGSTVAGNSRVVQQRVVVVRPAIVEPYFSDASFYPGFGWGLSYSYGPHPYNSYAQVPPRGAVPIELHVSPRKSTLIVDGTNVGQARDFSSPAYPLWLEAGSHVLELNYPGYQTLRVKFEAKRGRAYRIRYDLREGEGIDSRSSGEPERR
jgi:PEGA domain-containing protein